MKVKIDLEECLMRQFIVAFATFLRCFYFPGFFVKFMPAKSQAMVMGKIHMLLLLPIFILLSAFSNSPLSKIEDGPAGFCEGLKFITGKFDSSKYTDVQDKKIAERGQDKMYSSKVLLQNWKELKIVTDADGTQFWATYDKRFENANAAKTEFEKLADEISKCLGRGKKEMDVDGGYSYVFRGNFETGAVYLVLKDNEISLVIS